MDGWHWVKLPLLMRVNIPLPFDDEMPAHILDHLHGYTDTEQHSQNHQTQ